ncbi:hypothetical protein ACTXT7_003912 [Hymenolepis weldensis]
MKEKGKLVVHSVELVLFLSPGSRRSLRMSGKKHYIRLQFRKKTSVLYSPDNSYTAKIRQCANHCKASNQLEFYREKKHFGTQFDKDFLHKKFDSHNFAHQISADSCHCQT